MCFNIYTNLPAGPSNWLANMLGATLRATESTRRLGNMLGATLGATLRATLGATSGANQLEGVDNRPSQGQINWRGWITGHARGKTKTGGVG